MGAKKPAQKQVKKTRLPSTPSDGGDKRDRTADLLNAIQALSQLSYTPIYIKEVYWVICILSCAGDGENRAAPLRLDYNSRWSGKCQGKFLLFLKFLGKFCEEAGRKAVLN